MNNLFIGMISTIGYSIIGMVFCAIGYKVFDLITPFDLNKEIDDHNLGAGLAVAGIFIAIAIVISGVIV
jgi:putative membrane protein